MRHAANTVFAIAVIVAEVASVGLTATSADAQGSTSSQVRQQQRLLLQQQRQLAQDRRELDAQRRQLARQGAGGAPVSHGLFGDCPLGFTAYLIGGCQPDHAVIVYNGGSLGGRPY